MTTSSDLIESGFSSIAISSDLFPYGIRVRHWVNFSTWQEALEYSPRTPGDEDWKVIVTTYEEQVAFHRLHGLNIVNRGEQWFDGQATPLFLEGGDV